MCGGRRRRRGGSDATAGGSGGRGFCAPALAVVALAAAAAVAFLEGTAGGLAYAGDGWFHECAKWDAEGGRFLVSTFFGAGVAEVRVGARRDEALVERVVVQDPEVAGRMSLGLVVDAPRRRILVAYAGRPPSFNYAAVGAYDLASGRRLFLARLDGPGESSFADDVASDDDGNVYVTDILGNKIWKVSPDGEPLSVIKNATFTQRRGTLDNLIGLNGIVYHPNGYLLVVHTSGGDLFKLDPRTGAVSVVRVRGSLKSGDGLELLSPTKLVVAGMPNRLVESSDDWETASITGRYFGPAHRVGSSATVKDGDVYVNHIFGFGLGRKKTHVLAKAVFAPL